MPPDFTKGFLVFLCCCRANQVKAQIQEETQTSVIGQTASSTSLIRPACVVQDQEEETLVSTASNIPRVQSARTIQVSFDQVTVLNHDTITDLYYGIMTGESLTISELIERCPHLIKLDLSKKKFTSDQWIQILQAAKNLRGLRELNLMLSNFSNDVAEGLSELDQIEKLNLNFSRITAASFSFLPSSLTELGVAGPFDGRDFVYLQRLKGLTGLNLSGSSIEDDEMLFLLNLRNLREFSLTCVLMSFSKARTISQLPHLEKLSLGTTRIRDTGISYLTSLPLIFLDLTNSMLTDSTLSYLREITTLEVLLLRCNSFTNDGLQSLAHTSLKVLDLSQSREITMEGLAALLPTLELKKLILIDFYDFSFDNLLGILLQVATLEEVDLSYNKVTLDQISCLKEEFSRKHDRDLIVYIKEVMG